MVSNLPVIATSIGENKNIIDDEDFRKIYRFSDRYELKNYIYIIINIYLGGFNY